jgi:hypothetical protein
MIYVPLDRERITIDDTSGGKSLTSTKLNGNLVYARVQVLTAAIRVTLDGTAPVATTTGELWNPAAATFDAIHELWGQAMATFKAIRDTGSSGAIEVTYYGRPAQS